MCVYIPLIEGGERDDGGDVAFAKSRVDRHRSCLFVFNIFIIIITILTIINVFSSLYYSYNNQCVLSQVNVPGFPGIAASAASRLIELL
jgi:hypothetical protein